MKLEINLHSVTVIRRLYNNSLAKAVSLQVRLQGRSHTVCGALNYRIRWSFTSLFLEDKAFRPLSRFSLSPLLLISAIPLYVNLPSPHLSLSFPFFYFLSLSFFLQGLSEERVYTKDPSPWQTTNMSLSSSLIFFLPIPLVTSFPRVVKDNQLTWRLVAAFRTE